MTQHKASLSYSCLVSLYAGSCGAFHMGNYFGDSPWRGLHHVLALVALRFAVNDRRGIAKKLQNYLMWFETFLIQCWCGCDAMIWHIVLEEKTLCWNCAIRKSKHGSHAAHILAESWVVTTYWAVCVAEGVVGSHIPGIVHVFCSQQCICASGPIGYS